MYWTHHFAHHDSLRRACSWLEEIGFAPERIEAHYDGVPRLAMTVSPTRIAELEMLINAVERTDPHGWPSFWDVAQQSHVYPSAGDEAFIGEESTPVRTGAIGWHPQD